MSKKKIIFDSKKTAFFANPYNTVAYIPLKRNENVKNLQIILQGLTGEVGSGDLEYKEDIKVMPYIKPIRYSNLDLKVECEKFFVGKTKILNETMKKAIGDLRAFGFTFDNEYYLCDNPNVPIGILLRNHMDLMLCIIAPVVEEDDLKNALAVKEGKDD